MYKMLLIALLLCGCGVFAQTATGVSEPLANAYNQRPLIKSASVTDSGSYVRTEEEIKAKLISLALKNPALTAADANIRIAEIARKKANNSFLNSFSAAGNINEFVIENSPASNYWPKYNFGVMIPMDMFARNKAEKRTADEQITINNSQKQLIKESLKARVIAQYEIYKEKKELLELQRIVMDDDTDVYEKAQKDYKNGVIPVEEVNKIYRMVISSRGYLVTKEKELNIAIVDIEETIGVPLKNVLGK